MRQIVLLFKRAIQGDGLGYTCRSGSTDQPFHFTLKG